MDSLNWKHRLLVLKITLFVILAGLLVVGRSSSAWPIVNWTIVRPGRFVRPFALPSHTAVALCLVAAALTGALWNTDASLRPLFNFGRMLDQQTIWYVVAPIASLLLLMSSVGLIQWVIDWIRRRTLAMRGEQAPA